MIHQRVNLQHLRASDQPRSLATAAVDRLADSIRAIGLIQPITVRKAGVMVGGLAEAGYQIVAGHHRVAAARALGWSEIDAIVIEAPEHLQAELIEIDENLCRSELTAAQRSAAVKRRKQIWGVLHPEEIQVAQLAPPEIGYGKPPPQNKGFAASTATVSNESKSQVNRHLARADALGEDELQRIVGTSLDKGTELDALAKLPAAERKALIDRAVAGGKVSAKPPAPIPHPRDKPYAPADDDRLAEASHTIAELADENETLRTQVAVGNMDVSEEAKLEAAQIIEDLRAQLKTLTAELDATRAMRDRYQAENRELMKQVAMQQRELKRAREAA